MEFSSISENSTSVCRAIVYDARWQFTSLKDFAPRKIFLVFGGGTTLLLATHAFSGFLPQKSFSLCNCTTLWKHRSHTVLILTLAVFFANIHCASQCWNEWVEWKMGRVTTIVNFDSICLFIKKPSPFLLCNRLSIASSHHYYHERRHTNSERHALVLWPRSHDHDHHLCSSWSAIDS